MKLLTKRFAVPLFFFILLSIGLMTFRDYGVHWDEYNNQIFGHIWRVYIIDAFKNGSLINTPLPPAHLMNWLHGPAIEILLGNLKNLLGLTEVRDILLFRHLCCFLIFVGGVFFFYLLCLEHFKDWKLALLGCLFLVTSPRIWAHSFYDTFDIPFLSFYILSLYTLLRWIKEKTFINAMFHALACAILIDIRLIGLLVIIYTLFIGLAEAIKDQPKRKIIVQQLILFGMLTVFLIVLGWPLLWSHPILHFKRVLIETLHASFPYSVFYLGKFYIGDQLPWHYGPVFLLTTTPLFYVILFGIGTVSISKNLFQKNHLLFLACFFLPLLLTTGKLYNGWRHLFFIYPVFIIFSLTGLLTLWRIFKYHLWLKNGLILLTLLCVGSTIHTMTSLHPYEFVYFNRLAGQDLQKVKTKFELDYWGLPYRQALEYILKTDPDALITVSLGNNPWPLIKNNMNILSIEDRKRLKEVPIDQAKYFITNYLQHPADYPLPEYASIKAADAKIVTIFKLK